MTVVQVESCARGLALWQERKAEAALGRMCKPKARSGKIDLPDEIVKQFKAGGQARSQLIHEFMAANKDKAWNLDVMQTLENSCKP